MSPAGKVGVESVGLIELAGFRRPAKQQPLPAEMYFTVSGYAMFIEGQPAAQNFFHHPAIRMRL